MWRSLAPVLLAAVLLIAPADPGRGASPPDAARTPADLTAQINRDMPEWIAEGVALATWGPDLGSGRVRIAVVDLVPSEAERLRERYGANRVEVIDGGYPTLLQTDEPECTGRGACFRLRAGLDVVGTAVNGGCTSGFQVTLAGSNVSGMLTAGHCVVGNGAVLHQLRPVGPVVRNAFEPVPSVAPPDLADDVPVWVVPADAAVVAQSEAGGAHVGSVVDYPFVPSNLLYASNSAKSLPVTGELASPSGGESVCFSGRTSTNPKCGSVTATNQSIVVPGVVGASGVVGYVVITGMGKVHQLAVAGDSGGPVWGCVSGSLPNCAGVRAVGLVSATAADNSGTFFSPVGAIEQALGVDVRTSTPSLPLG